MARRPRGSLDAPRVLEAAFALAREKGLAALTMTELATRLGVGLTSVYWHVRNREDLCGPHGEEAVVRVRDQLPALADLRPDAWQEQLREYFLHQRRVFTSDDLLADLTVMRNAPAGPQTIASGSAGSKRCCDSSPPPGSPSRTPGTCTPPCPSSRRGPSWRSGGDASATTPPTGAPQVRLLDPRATPAAGRLGHRPRRRPGPHRRRGLRRRPGPVAGGSSPPVRAGPDTTGAPVPERVRRGPHAPDGPDELGGAPSRARSRSPRRPLRVTSRGLA